MTTYLSKLNSDICLSIESFKNEFQGFFIWHDNSHSGFIGWGLNRRKSVLYNSTGTAHTPASNMKISLKLTRGGGCVMTIFNINKGLK